MLYNSPAKTILVFPRLSDSGESAKEWEDAKAKKGEKGGGAGKNEFPPVLLFVLALPQFRGPDYLGA